MLSESPKVRAVVLNTNLYLESNSATSGQSDPGDQFAWFDTVMNAARGQGEMVSRSLEFLSCKIMICGWLK